MPIYTILASGRWCRLRVSNLVKYCPLLPSKGLSLGFILYSSFFCILLIWWHNSPGWYRWHSLLVNTRRDRMNSSPISTVEAPYGQVTCTFSFALISNSWQHFKQNRVQSSLLALCYFFPDAIFLRCTRLQRRYIYLGVSPCFFSWSSPSVLL